MLLSAAQALELQPGTITIGTESDEQGVVVMIGATGRGIEPEHLPRIFDPFFTTRRPGQGTGMGLAVCHGTLTRHGDAIDLESAPDRGTLANGGSLRRGTRALVAARLGERDLAERYFRETAAVDLEHTTAAAYTWRLWGGL